MTNTPFTRRSTAVREFRLTAQVIAGLPTQPHAPDQWTVAFADFGHDLLVLGTLPTPDPRSETAADLFAVLYAQDLSSYEVTAPTAADAEHRAREYFAAERMGVAPWPELGLVAMPGTPIPADGGPTALRIATQAFAARGLTPYHDDDAGNTWLVIGPDKTLPGKGVPYAVLFVYNPTSDEGEEEITVDRPLLPSDEWHIGAGDGHGNERHLTKRPVAELAECVDVIVDLLAEHRD
ncbi:hypothetical protein [Streptomyces ipomoeae]|uniref:hypothetical protein n=1 Tax=Streptomyces ipomoeae TaxID=103232 RepID=UPI0029A5F94A|nr:hypothetical protein [Streptomyces ipomoeae]MDX2692208.1 hypothetical protein [Streptomyces ipomoeae]MDX2843568.1 hypothetical protein [Streptomyces ipomoeae]